MRHIRHFFSRWQNWLGFLLVLFFSMVAMAAPVLSPMDAKEPGIFQKVGRTRAERLSPGPRPPSDIAPLGTLPYQYDVFHTLVWGARDALSFGLMVVLIAGVFGVVFGAVAGYAGGTVNTVMMRVTDAFLAFPVIAGVVFLQQLMAIAIESAGGIYVFSTQNPAYFGAGPFIVTSGEASPIQILLGIINPLMLSLILFSWMPYARLINSTVMTLKHSEFIQASRALGASSARMIFHHLIPNSVTSSIVLMARDVGGVVLLQATLTFVKLGGNSPWGDMLYRGRDWILNASGLLKFWWVYLPATFAVMLFAIAWNLLGDGLNDLLDPTATYEYRTIPFWSRIFRESKKQVLVENDSRAFAHESLIPPRQSIQPAQVTKTSSPNGVNAVLLAAREEVSNGNIPLALHSYQHLIQRGKLLDEILPDLARLVKRSPRDPQVWQTLGDALARGGDSIHATQSYEQARKLVDYESL
jgi:peptide/nickel transport system permease protein